MADDAAGSVRIDIGGNLAPFEAALAKARQMANAFDAEVSKKLSGSSTADAAISKIAAEVEKTNAMLAKLTGTATPAAAAVSKLATESTQASSAISGVGTSSVAASASVGKLAAEANSAAASIQRAVAANGQFAASNLQMANGTAARAEDIQAYGAALDDIRAKYNPLFRVTREYLTLKEELRIATKLGAITETEAAATLTRERQATLASIAVIKGHTGALNETGNAARLSGMQLAELGHVVRATAGTMLAGGTAMQALGYEATRIASILGQGGGVGPTLAAIGGMATSAIGKIAGFVASSTILRGVGVAAIGASLGFEAIRDSASEAEHRSVGFGETFTAIFQTIGNYLSGTWIGSAFNGLVSAASYAFGKLRSAATDLAEWTINAFRAVGSDMAFIWNNLPTIVEAAAVGAANALVSTMEAAVNRVADAVNSLNDAFGGILPKIEHTDLGRFANPAAFDLAAKNAEHLKDVMGILNSTPLRDFGKNVVDQIATNHALESLGDLSKISFDSATSSANGLSSAVSGIGKAANGVTVEFGGTSQQIINVSRAFQDAKLAQMGQLQGATTELHKMQAEAKHVQEILDAAPHASVDQVFGEGFAGNAREAQKAIDRTVNSIDRLFAAYDSGNATIRTVNDSVDLLRQTLLAQGGDPVAINAFVDSVISGEIKVRQLRSGVQGLSDDIRNIPNKTVTITVRTQQIGTGTQSQYSVPNQSGGYSGVGVTRYGGIPGQQSGPSITANTVPNISGYGSQGGSGDLGTSTVNVTRFGGTRAAGGPVTANMPYWVGEHGPELVVPAGAGSVVPNPQSMALANPQSGFTGREATREQDRLWTVLMNIEANTRKTYEGVEKWITTSSYSGSSSGSSGGSSSLGSSGSSDSSAYAMVLAQIKANFHAAGIVGGGSIGYGAQGLGATPEQIARNIVNGGQSPLGSAGANDYENTLAQTQVAQAQSEARRYQALYGPSSNYEATRPATDAEWARLTPAMKERIYNRTDNTDWHKELYGFSTGGMMGPGNGDTQQVEFFKNPNERVIIARPDQFQDARSQPPAQPSNAQRPIQLTIPITIQSGAQVSKDSLAALRTQLAAAGRDMLRSINGR